MEIFRQLKIKIPWNRDVEVPSGKPKSKGGFTINTENEIHNEPVSPREEKEDIKVTDRDIGVLFPSLLLNQELR